MEALNLICDVAKSSRKSLMADESQSSFQYLAFLADYDLIYDTALGMYDFDLCKAVARNSQKDPKVYLPQIARLKSLHPLLAKYDVDIQLGRYESAFVHLFEAKGFIDNHFAQCLDLIEKYDLHKCGLNLFRDEAACYRSIMISLGNSLLEKNKPELALATYLATQPRHIEGAKSAARACGDWRTFFSCCAEESDEDIKVTASYVAEEIASGRGGYYSKREEAEFCSRILLDYCNDVEGAIDSLISSFMWEESRRLAKLHNMNDLLGVINNSASSYGQSCSKDFEERSSLFEEANERYATVLKLQKELKKGDQSKNDNNSDNQSLFSVASNMSNASLYSNMSTTSTSSATSLSSVISLTPSNAFSLTGDHENKHKSKFNKSGNQKKKKKKKQRKRMKRGSEEELQQLVSTLKSQIVDDEYYITVIETIKFLAQESEPFLAYDIMKSYQRLYRRIDDSQQQRKIGNTGILLSEGDHEKEVHLDCEDEVDQLRCRKLPSSILDFFAFLPYE